MLAVMASFWAEGGRDVRVITLGGGGEPPFQRLSHLVEWTALGVAKESSSLTAAVWNNLRRIWAIRRAIREARPDCVISFMDKTNALVLLSTLGLGIPVVVTEHTDPYLSKIGRAWSFLRGASYRWADRIVVLNDRARAFWAERAGGKTTVIPNPVVLDDGPASHGGLVRRPVIVGMGRLAEEKRFDLFLAAFARVAAKHPEWSALILGEGPMRAYLEELREKLGLKDRVQLPGAVRSPASVLSQADVFVSSSRLEGFPMALCEAMACGLPVIATEYHEGVREIVQDGVNGLLVPGNDPDALAAAMDRLMTDSEARRRLGEEAALITGRYGIGQVGADWERLFAGLAS